MMQSLYYLLFICCSQFILVPSLSLSENTYSYTSKQAFKRPHTTSLPENAIMFTCDFSGVPEERKVYCTINTTLPSLYFLSPKPEIVIHMTFTSLVILYSVVLLRAPNMGKQTSLMVQVQVQVGYYSSYHSVNPLCILWICLLCIRHTKKQAVPAQ